VDDVATRSRRGERDGPRLEPASADARPPTAGSGETWSEEIGDGSTGECRGRIDGAFGPGVE
jgi:hypothetical protein